MRLWAQRTALGSSVNVSFPPGLAGGLLLRLKALEQPHLLGQRASDEAFRAVEAAEEEAWSRRRVRGSGARDHLPSPIRKCS